MATRRQPGTFDVPGYDSGEYSWGGYGWGEGTPEGDWGNPYDRGDAPGSPEDPQPIEQAAQGQYRGSLEGFDFGKFDNPEHLTPKYVFARHAANYDPKDKSSYSKLLADLRGDKSGYFKNASMRNDKLYGGSFEGEDLGEIDFQRDFEGGGGWHWETGGASPAAMAGFGGVGANPYRAGMGSGGSSGGGGGYQGGGGGNIGMMMEELKKLFPDGAYNEEIVNRRTENAQENLRRFNKGRMDNNRAQLAERGLLGSGPEAQEAFNREADIGAQYANAASGIYADESRAADSRMMQALQTAAGLSAQEAQILVDQFRATSDRDLGFANLDLGHRRAGIEETLGLGNLALGNMNAVNNYNLGVGRLGLDRDRLGYDIQSGDIGQWIDLLDLWLRGAGTSAGGYI